jgi:hypothetical protein
MDKQLIQRWLDQSCYDEQDQRELEDWCNVEKFAELIVKECIGVVQKGGGMCGAISSDTLKRHFYGVDFYGVEE